MNIGDYVRTKDGYIRKIVDICEEDGIPIELDKPILEDDTKWRNCYQIVECIQKEDVIKSSPNIIDLIEEGDILTIKDMLGNITKVEVDEHFKLLSGKIVSIVTKEQFERCEYKL